MDESKPVVIFTYVMNISTTNCGKVVGENTHQLSNLIQNCQTLPKSLEDTSLYRTFLVYLPCK